LLNRVPFRYLISIKITAACSIVVGRLCQLCSGLWQQPCGMGGLCHRRSTLLTVSSDGMNGYTSDEIQFALALMVRQNGAQKLRQVVRQGSGTH
jgi:hypothetical protein